MIQVFTGTRGPGASAILDNMFRDRKRVFIDLLKWDVPVIDDAFEVDQFDTEQTVYLVSAADDGEHLGSIRLLPTSRPHLLNTLFPYLCDGPVPAGAQIFEITRGCLSPRLRAADRLRVRNRLTTAAVQYGLIRDIHSFTCVADSSWLSQILSLGWDCRPLGEPRLIEGVTTGALRIEISGRTIEKLRAAGTYSSTRVILAEAATPLAA
jgi:N-acyl-L-homoserine lactone synthetase